MKKLLLIVVACTFLFACSDEKKSEDNEKTKKEETSVVNKNEGNFYTGKVVILYKNGNIKYVENYRDGIKEGDYMNCYKTGSKKAEGKYISGRRTGVWVWYDENGEVSYAINYDEMA